MLRSNSNTSRVVAFSVAQSDTTSSTRSSAEKENIRKRKTSSPEEEKDAMETRRIKNLRNHPEYRLLTEKLAKMEKRKRSGYKMHEEIDPTVYDHEIMEEVYGCVNETPEDWDKRAKEMGNEDNCEIDYLISTTARERGEGGLTDKVLVKYDNYAVPSWADLASIEKGKAQSDLAVRVALMDFVEFFLIEQLGADKFKEEYGFRYLQYEEGLGHGCYIDDKWSLYTNRLRAIEYSWNILNQRWNLPHIYIEDWTGKTFDDKSLREVEYIQQSIISAEVQGMLKMHKPSLRHIKCSPDCKMCSSPKNRHCCHVHGSIELDEDGIPQFVSGKPQNEVHVRFECGKECECSSKCQNRRVQNGRQHPLLIFRHPQKGWTLRVLTELAKHEYLGEYIGEITTGPSEGRAQQYDYDLFYGIEREDGDKEPLNICAYRMGNETRFMSHSCAPNIYNESTIIERQGMYLNRGAFRAVRKLTRGEEIAFDYFPDKDSDSTDIDFSKMFDECWCGAAACRFSKRTQKKGKLE